MLVTRNVDRAGFTDPQRISLVEQDLDRFDRSIESLKKSLSADIEAVRKALSRQTWVFVGAVISFTTAAIILAWQIALARP